MKEASHPALNRVLAAGVAGGAAEVLWIGLVAAVIGTQASNVARGVAVTVLPASAGSALAPWLGLAIHFALSVGIALVFARTAAKYLRGGALVAAALAALAGVWAFNFFVLLPAINPAFAALLPYPVTLVSKLLFGAGMAAVLSRSQAAFARGL